MNQNSPGLLAIITHTPFWVWPLLGLLVWRGFKATQPRETGLIGLVVFPLILLCLSAGNILSAGITQATSAGLGLGALTGVAAGLTLERRFAAVPVGPGRLLLPGEWTSMAIVLTAFSIGYTKAVAASVAPTLLVDSSFQLVTVAISAFFSAILLTRMVSRLTILRGARPA